MSSYSSLVEPESSIAEPSQSEFTIHETARIGLTIRFPRMRGWSLSRSKRIFDIVISIAVLAVFGIPMLLIAACVRLTSNGPAIFVQQRVGRGGRLFPIYKFRSMEVASHHSASGLTKAGDHRVTAVGRWLRKLKLDELPQFYNILRGDMSVVGPRPKLPKYSDKLDLRYRPGITGAASLAFRHEEDLLASLHAREVESFYQSKIRPAKAKIDAQYMRRASFRSDLGIVLATVLASLMPRFSPVVEHRELEEMVEMQT